MTKLVRGMGLFLVWCHKLICIVLSLCKHACKEVCDIKQRIDPYPLLVQSCDRWWPDFITFTACKRSIFGLKRGKKAQCVSYRCKDFFKRKKDLGVMGTLIPLERTKIFQKGKCHSPVFWNAFQIASNYFSFHRHFKPIKTPSKHLQLTQSGEKHVQASYNWFCFYFWSNDKVVTSLT